MTTHANSVGTRVGDRPVGVEAPAAQIPWETRPAGSRDVLWRYSGNPILGRNPIPRGNSVYNSAVERYADAFVGVFRVDHKNSLPFLHTGRSRDGVNWELDDDPITLTDRSGRTIEPGFAYDPRVTRIEGRYIVTWCNDFHGPTVALAETEDFKTFRFIDNAFVPYNRNGVLFPKRIAGKYAMLHRPSDAGHTPFGSIFLSLSPDLEHWGGHRHIMDPGADWWDGKKIGAGPVPIETDEGWLVLYHGVMSTCNGFHYHVGAALLDLDKPWRVIARSRLYLMAPEADYEVSGRVPNVCFPCAALIDPSDGRLAMYYGAADTHVAIAHGYLHEIIDFVRKNNTGD